MTDGGSKALALFNIFVAIAIGYIAFAVFYGPFQHVATFIVGVYVGIEIVFLMVVFLD